MEHSACLNVGVPASKSARRAATSDLLSLGVETGRRSFCFFSSTRAMNSSRGIALMMDGSSVPKMARSVYPSGWPSLRCDLVNQTVFVL